MSFARFDKDRLQVILESLDRVRIVAFGAACCERLLPNYRPFQLETGWGNENKLRSALNRIWEFVHGADITSEIGELTKGCDSVTPDSDDFVSDNTGYAQNAALAILSVLDYLEKNDVSRIGFTAMFCTDTVDYFVQEEQQMDPMDPQLESKILHHPFMQRELKSQHEDLAWLRTKKNTDLALIENRWRGLSNLRP